jgi:hypothetical protein
MWIQDSWTSVGRDAFNVFSATGTRHVIGIKMIRCASEPEFQKNTYPNPIRKSKASTIRLFIPMASSNHAYFKFSIFRCQDSSWTLQCISLD